MSSSSRRCARPDVATPRGCAPRGCAARRLRGVAGRPVDVGRRLLAWHTAIRRANSASRRCFRAWRLRRACMIRLKCCADELQPAGATEKGHLTSAQGAVACEDNKACVRAWQRCMTRRHAQAAVSPRRACGRTGVRMHIRKKAHQQCARTATAAAKRACNACSRCSCTSSSAARASMRSGADRSSCACSR